MGPGRGCRACLSLSPQRKGLFPGGAAPSTASRQAGCLAPVPSARKVWFPALALQLLFPFTRRESHVRRLSHFPLWQPPNLRTSCFTIIKRSETVP